MKVDTFLGVMLAIICLSRCQSTKLTADVVEVLDSDSYILVCKLSQSTNLTRWKYLAGPNAISLMSYQNGTCRASSHSFLTSSTRYSYACNSTSYQVTVKPNQLRHNTILSCKDAHQLGSKGSTWIIKIKSADVNCNYCQRTISFDEVEVTAGDNVTFACSVSSNVPYVNWNRNMGSTTVAMSVNQSGQCSISQGVSFLVYEQIYSFTCNQTVYQVTKLYASINNHDMIYTCTLPGQTEATGSKWILKIVKARVRSVRIYTPRSYYVNVTENTVVEFKCTTSSARPAASVYWYKHPNGKDHNETQITENITTITTYYDISVTSSILRLYVTRHYHDTVVFCKANNAANTTMLTSEDKRQLNVRYKADDPYIPEKREYRVIENTPGTLACTVKGGNPTPTLYWECNNVSLTKQSTINYNRSITTLLWTPSRNHTGTCTCTSQQTHFQDETVDVVLDVLYEASITSFIIEGYTQETVTVNEDDPVQFVCIADSNPTATMTLSYDSNKLETKTTNRLEYNITKANCLDAGLYVCNAYNPLRTHFDVLQLLVKCYPRAAKYVDRNLKTDIGASITIVFDVIAYPLPTYKWYQQVNETWNLLTENEKYGMTSSDVQIKLTIHNVRAEDFTSYRLIVENRNGRTEQVYTLSPYGMDSSTSPGLLIGGIIGGTIGIVVSIAVCIIVLRRHGYLHACSTILERRKNQDNAINRPAEESAYNNIGIVPEYEMIDQSSGESVPYSSLEQTQQSELTDNQNERKNDVYENLKVQVF